MTTALKMVALIIFIAVAGLFLGTAGLLFDWKIAKAVGIVSAAVLAVVFWFTSGLTNKTLDRFLLGRKKIERDDNA